MRVDSGVVEGDEITVHYDPLLAKLIAHAETRDAAIARAVAALRAYPILGIRTNLPFLIAVLQHPSFTAGAVHTSFIDEHLDELLRVNAPSAGSSGSGRGHRRRCTHHGARFQPDGARGTA